MVNGTNVKKAKHSRMTGNVGEFCPLKSAFAKSFSATSLLWTESVAERTEEVQKLRKLRQFPKLQRDFSGIRRICTKVDNGVKGEPPSLRRTKGSRVKGGGRAKRPVGAARMA